MAPFSFRKMKIAKGETEDFGVDALNADERKYFDSLVKAGLVELLESPSSPKSKRPKQDADPAA
jgi:hypothetical protein